MFGHNILAQDNSEMYVKFFVSQCSSVAMQVSLMPELVFSQAQLQEFFIYYHSHSENLTLLIYLADLKDI